MRLGAGARVGHGLTAGGSPVTIRLLEATATWEVDAVARVGILRALSATGVLTLDPVADLRSDPPGVLLVTATWTAQSGAALEVVRTLGAASDWAISGALALAVVRELAATALWEIQSSGALSIQPEGSGPVRFYLSTARGVVPIVGGLPVFSRATSAESEDPNGRAIEALPNTPQVTWQSVLGGLKRPVLRLQPAHVTVRGTQATDLLYYQRAPVPDRDAVYLSARIDWDPATGAGVLLSLSDVTLAPPRLRLRHAGDSLYAELHNGTARTEVEVVAPHATGQVLETLITVDVDADALGFVVALDGEVAGSASAPLPAGGLPPAWSDRRVVLNGYNQAPTWAGYAELKVIDLAEFSAAGDARLAEVRDYILSPSGERI